MQGQDGLSTLSEYRVRLLHPLTRLAAKSILGRSLSLCIRTAHAPRYLSGIISSLRYLGQAGEVDRYHVYEVTVVPWFWLTSINRDCRIYQKQSVPEIIRSVLTPYHQAFKFNLTETYAPRDYCVQFEESDFQFVCRLLEAEGIHYYFVHDENGHTLVMSDEVSGHQSVPGYEQVRYFHQDTLAAPQQDYMTDLVACQTLGAGRFTTSDYNYTHSRADLTACSQIPMPHAHSQAEVYESQGNYTEHEMGERLARQRMQQLLQDREIKTLRSTARGVATGSLFHLTHHPSTEENQAYLVLATRYDLKENHYHSIDHREDTVQNGHRCQFELTIQDARLPLRPPRTTIPPRIPGVHSAVVVGPKEHEIWTDNYGRVKVQFHWDRYGKKDENSSCWIRVNTPWASQNYGVIHTPRVGDEVIVVFYNGNPDLPIIIGSTYNDAHMPPWTMPENATQSGVYSRSTPDGNYTTANAIRFEDRKGQEQLWIHAERNQNIEVEHDETHWVGRDRHKTINHNEHNRIGHTQNITIGHFKAQSIGAGYIQNVGLVKMTNVGMAYAQNIGMSKQVLIGREYIIKVGQKLRIEVGNTVLQLTANGHVDITGKSINISAQGGNVTVNAERVWLKPTGGKARTQPGEDHPFDDIQTAMNIDVDPAVIPQAASENAQANMLFDVLRKLARLHSLRDLTRIFKR